MLWYNQVLNKTTFQRCIMDGLMLVGMFAAIIYFIVCIYKSNKFDKETNGMYRTKSNNDDDGCGRMSFSMTNCWRKWQNNHSHKNSKIQQQINGKAG